MSLTYDRLIFCRRNTRLEDILKFFVEFNVIKNTTDTDKYASYPDIHLKIEEKSSRQNKLCDRMIISAFLMLTFISMQ